MSRHAQVPPSPGTCPRRLSSCALLDHCRRLAGSRLTGDFGPADQALDALRAMLPPDEAYRLFGFLHDLVAIATAGRREEFRWHPVGARRRSADEQRLAEDFLDALSTDRGRLVPGEAVVALAESYCAAAERGCGLHAATGEPCAGGCPFAEPVAAAERTSS
ncbi:hypothetical protein [Salinarimonas rosea]|uniref:hypothetical protein n=1 Tax=Salinarimonas rosea TaxID=552063 RepID=UPI0012EB5BFA|nr:hypothetical protein [Salinarimonas rosea]